MSKFIFSLILTTLLLLTFSQFVTGQNTPKALAQQILKDDSYPREMVKVTKISIKEVMEKLNTRVIDLNGDKFPEYIVSGASISLGCGAQNCPFWIYKKNGNKFIRILEYKDGESIMAASVKVLKTKTKGYYDIEGYYHCAYNCNVKSIYKFDGSKYVFKTSRTTKPKSWG